MFKKIIYYVFIISALENVCYGVSHAAAKAALKQANKDYMTLIFGSQGINDAKGTPEQLRQMVDGCITAGITDRLYGFDAQLMASFNGISPQKKLHVLLAYAFYAIGYYNWKDVKEAQGGLLSLGIDIKTEPNFDREFTDLRSLAFNKGTIFQYKNNLEDVIRRTAKGLKFDDFVDIEERYLTEEEIDGLSDEEQENKYHALRQNKRTRDLLPSQVSAEMLKLFPNFKAKYAKRGTVKPAQAANSSASPVSMTSQAPSPLIGASAGGGHDLTAPLQLAADAALKDVGFPSKATFTQAGNRAEDFERYAKMLKILPLATVQQKMQQEGVNFPTAVVSSAPVANAGGTDDESWFKKGYYNKTRFISSGGEEEKFSAYRADASSASPLTMQELKIKYALK